RSRVLPAAVGVFCGLVGLYAAWGADSLARLGIPPNGDVLLAFRPDWLQVYIKLFYEQGFWGIGHGVGNNNNGQMVSGVFLAAVWLVEAVVILGFSAFIPWKLLGSSVYCEHCERWIDQAKEVQRLSLVAPESAMARIVDGDLSPLDAWPRAKPT